ncbi:MAG TPA: KH domain-containing protein [Nitrospinota bacterium]|nr:KH domain-containing protein [Nitrospinota bacterium]
MKELIEFIAKSLVENSEQVEVREVQGDKTTIIELKVAQEDMGKIIGKQGKTARTIRTLMNATAAKANKKAVLEILE